MPGRLSPRVPAYVLIDSHVTDAARYATYAAEGGRILPGLGGRFLSRGGRVEVLEGSWTPTRIVVIEFPDVAAARRWYQSPQYQAARRMREGAADFRCVIVEGVAGSGPAVPSPQA
ncbi:MAG: hypothetical protein QOJ26_1034 [Thermoplasmata archaeon]|jgi:uncharacterized protein (DUF1330 family)|nr:hypothetical protein [Thermoplasmata archaeon]MEA3166165.1 hypothetical protein [Thermoplasmata archaeon]